MPRCTRRKIKQLTLSDGALVAVSDGCILEVDETVGVGPDSSVYGYDVSVIRLKGSTGPAFVVDGELHGLPFIQLGVVNDRRNRRIRWRKSGSRSSPWDQCQRRRQWVPIRLLACPIAAKPSNIKNPKDGSGTVTSAKVAPIRISSAEKCAF